MKIGYNKLIISLPVILAALLAALVIYSRNEGLPVNQESYFLVAGLFVLSVPMFFVSYIIITDKEIIVNNQFGMPRRRAAINGYKDIKFENGNILVRSNGEFKKFRINKILADVKGLKELKSKAGGAK